MILWRITAAKVDVTFLGSMDMYPQLLAYKEQGIAAIRQMPAAGAILQEQLLAWEQIELGRIQQDPTLIWSGNERLLRVEQEVVLQGGAYAANPAYWSALTNASIFGSYLAPMPSPIPGDDSVFQTFRTEDPSVPDDASIGNFDARWAWITSKQLPAIKTWSDANQQLDVARLLVGGYKSR